MNGLLKYVDTTASTAGYHSGLLSAASLNGVGAGAGRGSLFEHVQVQVQGAHCLVSIYLPVTHASQGHSSSGGNVDPSSQMPWSPRGRSALCHLFHRMAPAREDGPPGAEEGGFSAWLSDVQTDRQIDIITVSSTGHTYPGAASCQQKHLSGEPSQVSWGFPCILSGTNNGNATQIR